MCNATAVAVGATVGKTIVDIKQQQQVAASSQIRASQQVAQNAQKEALAKENLKVKFASSLRQENQKIEQAAIKAERARRSGIAERASIIALNPYQNMFGAGSIAAALRDSQRREGETKFSISDNLKTMQFEFQTARQIDVINTGVQIASLPQADAIVDPTLGILGTLGSNAPRIIEQLERVES